MQTLPQDDADDVFGVPIPRLSIPDSQISISLDSPNSTPPIPIPHLPISQLPIPPPIAITQFFPRRGRGLDTFPSLYDPYSPIPYPQITISPFRSSSPIPRARARARISTSPHNSPIPDSQILMSSSRFSIPDSPNIASPPPPPPPPPPPHLPTPQSQISQPVPTSQSPVPRHGQGPRSFTSLSEPHNQELRFPCVIEGCSRKFKSQYLCLDHMDAHVPKPSFPCTHGCSMTFSGAFDRLRHEATKHQKINDVLCRGCGRFFSTKKGLDDHLLKCRDFLREAGGSWDGYNSWRLPT